MRLVLASDDNVSELLPRMRAFNASENIAIADDKLIDALQFLFATPELGCVWIVTDDHVIGYAVVTFGFDLEFAGRDAYLTELWIDERERGRGAGSAVLALIADELRERDVRAVHLHVRPENGAMQLYERAGFTASPRIVMTRVL